MPAERSPWTTQETVLSVTRVSTVQGELTLNLIRDLNLNLILNLNLNHDPR